MMGISSAAVGILDLDIQRYCYQIIVRLFFKASVRFFGYVTLLALLEGLCDELGWCEHGPVGKTNSILACYQMCDTP
jgi:hypothetical protein